MQEVVQAPPVIQEAVRVLSAIQEAVQVLSAIQEAVQVLSALLGLAQVPVAARQHLWVIAQEKVALDYVGSQPLVLEVSLL
jgi:hypothetical protein